MPGSHSQTVLLFEDGVPVGDVAVRGAIDVLLTAVDAVDADPRDDEFEHAVAPISRDATTIPVQRGMLPPCWPIRRAESRRAAARYCYWLDRPKEF